MVRKKEQFRMKELLTEAITVLCKASLAYRTEFSIEGLLGITLDNEEIFLVNINEHVKKEQDANNPVPTHTSRSPSPPSPPSYQRKSPSPRQRSHDSGRTSPSSLRRKRRRLDVKNESSSNPIIIKEEDDDDDHWYGSGSTRIPTPQDAVESGMGIMTSPRLQSDGRGVDALTKMVDSVTGESSEMPYVVNQVPSIDAAPGDDVDKGGGGGEEDFGSHLNLSAENSLQNALPGCSSWDSFQQPAQDTDQKKIGDLKLPLNEVSSDRTLVKVERLDPEVNDNDGCSSSGVKNTMVSMSSLSRPITGSYTKQSIMGHNTPGTQPITTQTAANLPMGGNVTNQWNSPSANPMGPRITAAPIAIPYQFSQNVTCPTCGVTFISRDDLKRHLPDHGIEMFACLQCEKMFASKTMLRQHEKVVHSAVKYICHICERQLSTRQRLRGHYLSQHGTNEPLENINSRLAQTFPCVDHEG